MFEIESRTKYKSGDRASRLVSQLTISVRSDKCLPTYLQAAIRAENTAITDLEDDATTSSSTFSKTKKRKYEESYFSFGFVDSNGSPLCMLCSKLLPNSYMAPAKLRRHLETVHSESKVKNKEFLVRKKEQLLESPKNMMHVTETINEKATEVSYLVSYRMAQAGEVHTIAENLIKPCVLDITKCMFDEKSVKHVSTVPLSNDTVSRLIHDLATYVKQEIITRLQKTRFALQMDESTDVSGLFILLVIVRYPYESSFDEDMLMCSSLPINTTGEEISNKINIFFEENNLSWNDCIDICTDGVKAMTEMSSDTSMESLFKTTPLNDFWCRNRDEYPMLGKMTLNILLLFPTTYLCETGFSTYAATKTKYRNRLDAEPDMRLQLSSIKSGINQMTKNKKSSFIPPIS
ncbi:Zinc finger BED domain-containing protein 5 [Eumeta japonica]|uniref:Zinc finger BED domain-containing protein 5 n=1 Tax=Eumeta variegata TaxID=151549 RepID=A0A4C1XYY4_EUMVA|nr:Zinc finger BED domain-containing protein 5 [Eumeta japonica]